LGGGGEPFVGGSYGAGENPDEIVAAQRRTQTTGWRKAVSVMTFGLIKPGPSAKQQRDEELIRRIRASLLDVYVVAFVNSKGGVGKTTMAVAAGNAIARERGDRVIVVDVDRIQDACGYGVPLMDYRTDRDQLDRFAAGKGRDGLAEYRADRNALSLDGLPGW